MTCQLCGVIIDLTDGVSIEADISRRFDYTEEGFDQTLTYSFCNQAHMTEWLAATPLPAVVPNPDDNFGFVGGLFLACFLLTLLGLVAGSGYGFFLLVREIF